MDEQQQDICRVCRSEGSAEKPLYHPCICTGSIKYIHQDCLVQWLRYSEKEYCELCNYRFSFIPIYSPDMPKRLPIRDIIIGLLGTLATAIKYWIHYTIVTIAWLGIVPLTAYRINRCLFAGSFAAFLSLPFDLFSTENITTDGFYGCCAVISTLCAFIGLVWLSQQIMRGGGPDWLELQPEAAPNLLQPQPPNPQPQNVPGVGLNNNINNNNMGENAEVLENMEHNEEENLLPNANDAEPIENVQPLVIAAPENNQANHNQLRQVAHEDIIWNPEWDRVAEEMTWERILGLDGSLVFIEHVFWVVSLNTLLILIFALFPYHIGTYSIKKFGITHFTTVFYFDGFIITLFGYIIIAMALVLLHFLSSLLKFREAQRLFGLCYMVVKVSLLSVFEIGLFPLIFGWWFDICSLPLLGATLSDRENNFRSAPGTSLFMHWLIGMTYAFHFASFILLLKDVLRPEVLWFLQNLNDPDFNPIQEMIHLPIMGHIRKFLASLVIFGTAILLMIWLPVCIIQHFLPGFLPYNVIQSSNDSPEISTEFLILQLILPALIDHAHLRHWLKTIIRTWCVVVSYILGIRSYLLGDDDQESREALALAGDRNESPIYARQKFFILKLFLLIIFTAISVLIGGLLTLTVPVMIGRKLFFIWMKDVKVHELNTAACGLYVGLILARLFSLLCNWIPRGWNAIVIKAKECVIWTSKTLLACFILIGLIPLLIGLLFDVVIIVPIRVPLNQTPIFYLWQDWAFGVLHSKVICGLSMMGEWGLREILEEIYHDGLVNINLRYIITTLALPVILTLGFVLSAPYVIIFGILPFFGVTFGTRNLLIRRIYPFLLIASVLIYLIHWQINKFYRLYEHIKNDKYLVGKRLVNYDPNKSKSGINNSPKSQSSIN